MTSILRNLEVECTIAKDAMKSLATALYSTETSSEERRRLLTELHTKGFVSDTDHNRYVISKEILRGARFRQLAEEALPSLVLQFITRLDNFENEKDAALQTVGEIKKLHVDEEVEKAAKSGDSLFKQQLILLSKAATTFFSGRGIYGLDDIPDYVKVLLETIYGYNTTRLRNVENVKEEVLQEIREYVEVVNGTINKLLKVDKGQVMTDENSHFEQLRRALVALDAKAAEKESKKLNFIFLRDNSSSMDSFKENWQEFTDVIIRKLHEYQSTLRVVSFTSDQVLERATLKNYVVYNSVDGTPIRRTIKEILKTTNSSTVIIILTDGIPVYDIELEELNRTRKEKPDHRLMVVTVPQYKNNVKNSLGITDSDIIAINPSDLTFYETLGTILSTITRVEKEIEVKDLDEIVFF